MLIQPSFYIILITNIWRDNIDIFDDGETRWSNGPRTGGLIFPFTKIYRQDIFKDHRTLFLTTEIIMMPDSSLPFEITRRKKNLLEYCDGWCCYEVDLRVQDHSYQKFQICYYERGCSMLASYIWGFAYEGKFYSSHLPHGLKYWRREIDDQQEWSVHFDKPHSCHFLYIDNISLWGKRPVRI